MSEIDNQGMFDEPSSAPVKTYRMVPFWALGNAWLLVIAVAFALNSLKVLDDRSVIASIVIPGAMCLFGFFFSVRTKLSCTEE
jgi:hypothetical protein